MNLKKYSVKVIAIILFTIFALAQFSCIYAKDTTHSQWFGIVDLIKDDNNNKYVGYSINGAPNQRNVAKIPYIVKYDGAGSGTYKDDDIGAVYCAKSGVGFANENGNVTDETRKKEYNVSYDMKQDRDEIKGHQSATMSLLAENLNTTGDILKDLVEKEITDDGDKEYSRYNALLALLDRLYLPKDSTKTEKETLTDKILSETYKAVSSDVIPPDDYEKIEANKNAINDNDIYAVQQAAIWYFTNYGEEKYKQGMDKNWLYIVESDADNLKNSEAYKLLKDIGDSENGTVRDWETKVLYNYLIEQAKEHADEYKAENIKNLEKAPIEIQSGQELGNEQSNGRKILGPISVTKNNGRPYTIEIEVKNGNTKVDDYKILDSEKQEKNKDKTVEDIVGGGSFYISVPSSTPLDNLSINITVHYNKMNMKLWATQTDENGQPIQPLIELDKEKLEQKITLTIQKEEPFDLALRKYITAIEGKNGEDKTIPNSRNLNNIDPQKLESKEKTTAEYNHRKDPVVVENGDIITYNITIYNEGSKKGHATEVVDQLPDGLEFQEVVGEGNFEVKEGGYDKVTNRVTLTRKNNENTLNAYTSGTPDSETITIKCKVTATPDKKDSKVLTNIAWIAEAYDSEDGKTTTADRDSEPETPKIGKDDVNKDNMEDYKGTSGNDNLTDNDYFYEGQQDDDDFEKLVILPEAFDLKLIKFITAVNSQNVPDRVQDIDVSKLNTLDENGQMIKTADYKLDKNPVSVKTGDIVTYTFRIYNEGTIDGYAEKITEDVPEGLQFIWSDKKDTELEGDSTLTEEEKKGIKLNQDYGWGEFKYSGDKIVEISSDFLSKDKALPEEDGGDSNLIKAFGRNDDGQKTKNDLHFKYIQVAFKVVAENISKDVIRNEAAITEDADENGKPVDDRDSYTDEWKKEPSGDFYDKDETNPQWPKYKEDDEDYDNLVLQLFDLALRKFITRIEDDVVDSRIPNPEYVEENDEIVYHHGKDPLTVVTGNVVEYTIRIFNEGTRDGYAAQILDDIPDGLVFLPDNETNVEYRWVMYRKLKDGEKADEQEGNTIVVQDDETYVRTTDPSEAEVIVTDYLSMEQSKDNLLKAFDKTLGITDSNPDYKDVKVAFKVVEPNSSDRVIVNSAQISHDTDENGKEVEDKDSTPGKWVEGEDDQDKEYIELREFDLALRKWVTQAIVIENGKQTVTATGHQPWDDPEQVVKVEIVHSKLNKVTVKFRYSIRVINQGDIEGYAKEVTDYVPEGLKFVAADNPGWTDEGNNVISTRLLENTLLKPGEYADVEVVLTWINSENGLGTVLTNTAEISEDYNEYGAPDKDSEPDNKKPGEDDIDDAPVILSIKTGQIRIYFTLGFIVLLTAAGGIVLIKRYVL